MQLRDYQEVGVEWFLGKKRGILADQVGLGKTIQCLEAIKRSGKKALVIVPKFVATQWEERAVAYGFKVVSVVGNSQAQRRKACKEIEGADLVIANYESVVPKYPELYNRHWEFVALDEAQFIQGRKAKRTAAIKKLINGKTPSEFVMLLTATPLWNRGDSLWSLLNALYPKEHGSYWRFVNTYCEVGFTPFGKVIKGLNRANLPRLQEILDGLMLRRLKRDVAKELPELIEYEKALDCDKRLQKENSHIRAMMKDDGYLSLMRLRTHLLDRASFKFEEDERLFKGDWSSSKKEMLAQVFENEAPSKILIFVVYKESARMVAKWLEELNYGWFNKVPITGDVQVSDREKIIEEFKNVEGPAVLLGTSKTMGTGIDLQFANIIVFLEHPSWVEVEQSIGRIDRIGATEPPTVYHPIQNTTIDKRVWRACKEKEALTDAVLLRESK